MTQPFNLKFEFNDIHQSIGTRFLKVASQVPEKTALESESGSLSYDELALRSRRFAEVARQHGCLLETAIVIGLRHPEDIIVAILGTLLVGCTYVLIETDFPSERIKFVVDDSEATLVIVDRKDKKILTTFTDEQRSCAVFFDEIFTVNPLPVEEVHTNPLSPASILYTSGSMGKPKGVLQIHRNILFHIYTMTKLFNITAEDKHSVLSSFIFDGSTTDLYCALLNGATLIPINIRNLGTAGLADRIQRHGVTLYHSTPTTYRELLNQLGTTKSLYSIRLIILGGESVTGQDYALFQKHFSSDCLFVNGYGATETSGFVALNIMTINTQENLRGKVVPIGNEPDGIDLFLLDAHGKICETEGELHVRSKYIGMGYWRDPELTKQSYRVDESDSETRIFRTGDIAQRCPDGKIRLLGRRDRQVKIRGYRVDLSEIEAVAVDVPQIYQAVVKVYDDKRTGSQELAMFITLHPGPSLTESDVRVELSSRLPHYMIPVSIEILERFPLIDTGKIDVKALVIKERHSPVYKDFFEQKKELHEIVLEIWSQVLGIPEIGSDDNFFDLSGNSLLMARVHEKLEERFSLGLPLFRLFEHPTLRTLVQYLEAKTERYDFEEILSRVENKRKTRKGINS